MVNRQRVTVQFLALLGCLAGCGGAAPRAERPDPGDAHAAPAVTSLPAYRHARAEFGTDMQFGFVLAERAFLIEPPPIPDTLDVATIQHWNEATLRPWLEQRLQIVASARDRLDRAAEHTHRERIIAGALLGLMYEDIGRVLRAVPIPSDLRSDPEAEEAFRYVVEAEAEPYLTRARRAYRACAANAIQPEDMHHYSSYCSARNERLPNRSGPTAGGANGQTTVEVSMSIDAE